MALRTEFTQTFTAGPNFTIEAVIAAAKGFKRDKMPELAKDFQTYAVGNIKTSMFPASWDSTRRDTRYAPLATSTIKDKKRMGVNSLGKPNIRTGTLLNSIKGEVSGDTIVVTASATHSQSRRAGLALSPMSLAGGMMRSLTGLVRVTLPHMTATTSPMGGRTALFGPKKMMTRGYLLGRRKRVRSSMKRTHPVSPALAEMAAERGFSAGGQSYAAAVNAQRPFLAFRKGLITKPFIDHMNEAAKA